MRGIYPRVSANDYAIATWADVLEKYSLSQCRQAYLAYVREGGERDPKPADILKRCRIHYKDPRAGVKPEPCDRCHGRGVVVVEQKGYRYAYRCPCPNGQRFYGLPVYTPGAMEEEGS